MATKHTPGPWTARLLHETQRSYCTILASHGDIASIGSSRGMVAEEIDANARLIAAAPDLLAALLRLLDEENPFQTDEDTCECGENGDGSTDEHDSGVCAHIAAARAVAKATGKGT